jgi:hypothetical protein
MRILHRTSADPKFHAYLKYDGWHVFKDIALDLTGCILFTESEAKLNPPGEGEEYQHYGCYLSLKELK